MVKSACHDLPRDLRQAARDTSEDAGALHLHWHPVGSHALTDAVDASSSTHPGRARRPRVQGFLTHPHTSAGRVPTDAGYRFYVDALMTGDPREQASFEAPEGYGNLDELLRGVSKGMSEVSRLLAVVAGPSALGDSLTRVDYLPLAEGALLLIVSMESGASSSATVTLPNYVGQTSLARSSPRSTPGRWKTARRQPGAWHRRPQGPLRPRPARRRGGAGGHRGPG